MNRVCLLLSYLLVLCSGKFHHKGRYSGEQNFDASLNNQFGSEYNLPKNSAEKENSVILEEAYPTISRRFYGSSLENRGEFGSKMSSFNVDREAGGRGDYLEPFDVSMPDSRPGSEGDMLSSHSLMNDMSGAAKDYAPHYSSPHVGFPDHGVVISDSVAKKIGLYDKDYLKKLGLESNKDGGEGGSGDDLEGGLPKEAVKKEKERLEKIGVEDFRSGKHDDDKKQVKNMKEVFKNSESGAGINYNENGVMVDKQLAEKLGLYDKDYLKKLGVWGEKDSEVDSEGKRKAKEKKKAKAMSAKSRSHDDEKEDESSAAAMSGDGESMEAKASNDPKNSSNHNDPKNSTKIIEQSEATKTGGKEEGSSKGQKRSIIPEVTHRHHHHHHNTSKKDVVHHLHHLDKVGVKRQLLNFMKPSNNFGGEMMEENSRNSPSNEGGQQMSMESQQLEATPSSLNQFNGMNEGEQTSDGEPAGSRSVFPSAGNMGEDTGMAGNVNQLQMNANNGPAHHFKRVHMTVGAGRAARDGAIHITADGNSAAQAIAQRGSQGTDISDMLAKESAGIVTEANAPPEGALPSDISKLLSGAGMETEGAQKASFNGASTNPNQQTIMDAPRNLNDVYIDGDAAEMTKLEKPGNWKVGKAGEVASVNKQEELPDMVDKLLPLDKGAAANIGEENVEALNSGATKEMPNDIVKGITPSDNDLVSQILKSGDQAVETNEGRGELKKLLSAGQDNKMMENVVQARSGNGIEGMKGGPMPLTQVIPKTLPVLDSMGMIPRRFMQRPQSQMKSAMMSQQHRHQNLAGGNEESPFQERTSVMKGVPMTNGQEQNEEMVQSTGAQGSMFSSPSQERNDIGMQQESGGANFEEMGKLNGEAAGTSVAGQENLFSHHAAHSRFIFPGRPSKQQYARMQMTPRMKGFEPQQQQGEMTSRMATADPEMRKVIKRPEMPAVKAMPVEEIDNWAQAPAKTRKLHFRKGNNAHSFIRIKSRTRDDQLIKGIDYDDTHSSISVGFKKSSISPPGVAEDLKEHKKEKRQFVAEPGTSGMVSNSMSTLTPPYIETASDTPGSVNANILGSVQKVPSLAGMSVMPKSDYVSSFKKTGASQNEGMGYFTTMSNSQAMMSNKQTHHKGKKRGDNIINAENTMSEEMPSEMGGNFGASVPQTTSMAGLGSMGGMNAVNSFSGGSVMGQTPVMEGAANMNGDMGGMSEMGGVGKPVMGNYNAPMGFHQQDQGEGMGTGAMGNGGMGNGGGNGMGGNIVSRVVNNMGAKQNGDDKSIDAAMAEEDKIEADSTARNAGRLLQKTNEEDLSASNSGNLLKNTMDEGMNNFKANNSSDVSESNLVDNNSDGDNNEEGEGDSYDDGEGGDENEEGGKMMGEKSEKTEEGDSRTTSEENDLNQEIGDQVVKNNGHMTGHEHLNVVHGTPCTDCHMSGAIGHGAVISGSEAKKIGLNDEAYLKRLGIKECKIKGPGFSEGNHGGAISDEWAKKLDGFDKKYLQQLGIPEEALEGNGATRDCKFVERIAEVLQAQNGKDEVKSTATDVPKTESVKAVPKKTEKKVPGESKKKAAASPEKEKEAPKEEKLEEKAADVTAETPDDSAKKHDVKDKEEGTAEEKKADEAEDKTQESTEKKLEAEEKAETSAELFPNSDVTKEPVPEKKTESVETTASAEPVKEEDGQLHDNCTVRSTNETGANSTSDSPPGKDVTALLEETVVSTDGEKAKGPGAAYVEQLDKSIEKANATMKPADMEFLRRKQTVTHKLKHLEELKKKLKQLNSGILRSKITSDSKESPKKDSETSTRTLKAKPTTESKAEEEDENATRSLKALRKKLALKRRRRIHQLRKHL